MMFLSLLILTCHFIGGFTSDSFRAAIDANVVVLRSVVDKYRETMMFLREIEDSGDAEVKNHFGAIAHDSIYCLEIYEELFKSILLPSGLDVVYHDSREAERMSEGVAKACLTVSMVLRYLPMTVFDRQQFPSILAQMSILREDWRQLSESAESHREAMKREAARHRDSEPNKNPALDAKAVIRFANARFESSFSLINQSTREGADLSEASLMFVSFQRFLDQEISQLAQFDDLPVLAKITVIIHVGRICQRMREMMQAIPLEDWKSEARDTVEPFVTEWKRLGIKTQLVLRSLEETPVVDSELDFSSIITSAILYYGSTWSKVTQSVSQGSGRELTLSILENCRSILVGLNASADGFALLPQQGQLDIISHLASTCKSIHNALGSIPSNAIDAEFRTSMELKITQWRTLESKVRLFYNSLKGELPADAKNVVSPTASIRKEAETLDGSSAIIQSPDEERRSSALTNKKAKKKRPNQKKRKPNKTTISEQVDEESDVDGEDGDNDQAVTSTSTEMSESTTTTTKQPPTTRTTTEQPPTTTTTTEQPLTTTATTTTEESPISTPTRSWGIPKKTAQGRSALYGDSRDNIRRGRNQQRPETSVPVADGSTGMPLNDSREQGWNRSMVRNASKKTPLVDGAKSLQSPSERVRSTTSTAVRVTTTTMTTTTAVQTTTTTTTTITTFTTTETPTTRMTTTTEVVSTAPEPVLSTTEEALASTLVVSEETRETFSRLEIAPGISARPKRGSGGGRRTQKPIPPPIESQSSAHYQSAPTPWEYRQQQRQPQAMMYTGHGVIVPQTIVPISNQLRQMSNVLSETMAQIHQLSQQALQLSLDPNTAALASGNWHAMMETLHSVETLRSRLHAFAQYAESSLPPFLVQSPPGAYQGYNGPSY